MKTCNICSIELNPDNTKPYRLKNYIYKCNKCVNLEKKIAARLLDSSLINNRSRKYQARLKENNPVKYSCIQMLASSKKRAKVYSIDLDITSEYLLSISPTLCPIFNTALKYGGGEKTNMSASLDRIVPELGYIVGNVQIISNLGNMMKNSASSEELVQFSTWALRTYEKSKDVAREK